jgi:hypothetical protein
MTDEDPDDTPEYYRAKQEWTQFWKQIQDGVANGVDDDPAVALDRLVQKFRLPVLVEAFEQYIENLPRNFELRWRKCRAERLRTEEEVRQKAQNPNRAGRKPKRSDIVLLGVWLIVRRDMRLKGLTAFQACKLLVKPPTRREAARWHGLLLSNNPDSGPYYVKTPATLRDIYNDAVSCYRSGPERLRRAWDVHLDNFSGFSGRV